MPPGPTRQGDDPPGPRICRTESAYNSNNVPLLLLGVAMRRRGSTKGRKSPSGESKLSPSGRFSVFLRRASPPVGGLGPPCPGGRSTKLFLAAYPALLQSITCLPLRFARRCGVPNAMKKYPSRPRARRRNAASPDTLAYPGKRQRNRAGESLLSLR